MSISFTALCAKGPKSGRASLKTRKGRASLKPHEGLVQGKFTVPDGWMDRVSKFYRTLCQRAQSRIVPL
jgi:hypothetical protein